MLEIGIEHVAGVAVEHALLEQGIGNPLQDAALHLAFDLQRIHRASAILHRDDALDAHDAGLGVDRHLGELHAAQRSFAPRPRRRTCGAKPP